MSEPLAYLDGEFLPRSQASLALHDTGFVWGVTVTDLVRTFDGQLFRWPEHLARFRQSCVLACVDLIHDDAHISVAADRLVRHNAGADELCVVLFATPGAVGYYLGEPGGPGDRTATFGIYTYPIPQARLDALSVSGCHLLVPNVRQLANVDPHIKHRSRLHWWLAEKEVKRRHPDASALLLDEHGRVTETSAANFLIVKDGVVISPPVEIILPGVSRAVTRELCAGLGIGFEERELRLPECLLADEAMLTNTSYCLAGVRQLESRVFDFPGPVTQQLSAAWRDLIKRESPGMAIPGASIPQG